MAVTRRGFLEQAGAAAGLGLLAGCAPGRTDVAGGVLAGPGGVPCSTIHTFTNWAQTIQFQPRRFCRPRTEEHVVALVQEAAAAGTHLRTQGAGHSFSQLLPTTDTLITLDDLDRPIRVDGTRVTVPGGMRLKHLIPALRQRGFGFRNLGSITEQSIAGAFSTGTHGSGLGYGAISTQVVGLRMVTGTGEVRTITEADTEEMAAARINLGALGIITEVTLDVVPHYQLEYTAYMTSFDEVIDRIDVLNQENDRLVLWWLVPPVGRRDKMVVITKNPVGPRPRTLLRPATEAGTRVREGRLRKDERELRKVAADAPTRGVVPIRHEIGDYEEMLTIPLLPVFHRECEYAIPAARTVEALRAMREFIEEGDLSLSLPIEVRWVAADDILLSPCRGQAVCYIGASTLLNATEVFERFEPLMKSLGGRPHWGKNFTCTREELATAMYADGHPRFRAVRDRFDPARVFSNSFLDDVFP